MRTFTAVLQQTVADFEGDWEAARQDGAVDILCGLQWQAYPPQAELEPLVEAAQADEAARKLRQLLLTGRRWDSWQLSDRLVEIAALLLHGCRAVLEPAVHAEWEIETAAFEAQRSREYAASAMAEAARARLEREAEEDLG